MPDEIPMITALENGPYLEEGQLRGPTDQQPKPVVERHRDLRGGQHPHPRRGELDRQGEPIDAPTHGSDCVFVVGIDDEVRSRRLRALVEQRENVAVVHRRDPPHLLASDPERLSTGGQHRHPRTRAQQELDQFATRVEHMLAVVEADHRTAITEAAGEPGLGVGGWSDECTHRSCGDVSHTRRVAHGCEIDLATSSVARSTWSTRARPPSESCRNPPRR